MTGECAATGDGRSPDGVQVEAIAQALERDGWLALDGFLAGPVWRGLAARCRAQADDGMLRPAAVGHRATQRNDPALRGDRLRWLEPCGTPDEQALLARLDALRCALNRRLFLGLQSLEAHYALYPPGARYAPHLDRFRDDDARVVSLVAYLNDGWLESDGGALRLYLDPQRARYADVLPTGGRLVAFLSAEFEHAVLPATRERMSIAAWLRRG